MRNVNPYASHPVPTSRSHKPQCSNSVPGEDLNSAKTRRPPEGGLCSSGSGLDRSGCGKCCGRLSAATGHIANTSKAQDHHGPGGGFGDGTDSRILKPKIMVE